MILAIIQSIASVKVSSPRIVYNNSTLRHYEGIHTDGSKDVFVHKSAVISAGMRTLTEGQRVQYEIVMERGKSAAGNLSAA